MNVPGIIQASSGSIQLAGIAPTVGITSPVLIQPAAGALVMTHAATTFGISIVGANFVNQNNQVIQLRGVNASGYESMPGNVSHTAGGNPMANFGNWGPGYPPFTYLLANWGFGSMPSGMAPILRLPINEQAWLGLNVIDGGGAYYKADPASAYQGYIDTVVQMCKTNGIYIILDLHWTMPGPLASLAQNQFIDADHSATFWASVASYAANKPWVMLELFKRANYLC